MTASGRLLRAAVLAVICLGLIAPIGLGFWQTARGAFGVLPALGWTSASLDPWRKLVALPGFVSSLSLTLATGFGATILSLMLAIGFCTTVHGRVDAARGGRLLAPFLAVPHAALAVGLAFVIAPSGWIVRGVALFAGWDRPPDFASPHDSNGLALILGLMIKEVPFLVLVMLSALTQLPVNRLVSAGRALGYRRAAVWMKLVLPQLWPLIRLPVWVVLAYSLSTVDMAIILGPSNPPTFAVAVMRWFSDANPAMLLPASAAALLQIIVVGIGVLALWLAEWLLRLLGLGWLRQGGRGWRAEPMLWLASAGVAVLMLAGGLAMLSLLVWSVSWRWPFPHLVPQVWSLRPWMDQPQGWGAAFGNTLLLACASTALSLLLAIAWLEGEDRAHRGRAAWAEALIYLPLLIPQIGFLYGLNIVFLRLGISGGVGAVIWAQTLFVFPYVMIGLSDPWRALDGRMLAAAAALGAGPWRRLFAVKLPVLLRPVLTAAAIGISVSVAQYLPTLFLGAGRVITLTTEAVTLSSGSDRRITGVYASLQAALPFAAYLAAFVVPSLVHRNRRDLSGAPLA